ncbi:MAG TPA: NADH-quinone oxidoreductase subunit NuoE [Thermoanaerobaculia bacterium]|nr:NADH-quinone oxidoreductase subunit NuoE [Thermoanaerobaculia bacterium]
MSERESRRPTPVVGSPVGGVGTSDGYGEPWPAQSPGVPVLDEASRRRVEELVGRYPDKRAALIPVLHIAQRRCGGWLPDYAIAEVAAALELTPADVYGVVTFYDLFHQKPVGRHRIRVCTNLSCQLRGSDEVMAVLRQELGVDEGDVTPDGRCSYVHFECLGSCDTAPMMMIDDTYHENLTPERVREIVKGLT